MPFKFCYGVLAKYYSYHNYCIIEFDKFFFLELKYIVSINMFCKKYSPVLLNSYKGNSSSI